MNCNFVLPDYLAILPVNYYFLFFINYIVQDGKNYQEKLARNLDLQFLAWVVYFYSFFPQCHY